MAATAEKPRARGTRKPKAPAAPKLTRDEAAEALKKLLTEEPQTTISLQRKILGDSGRSQATTAIRAGLQVLESRHEARRIPRVGWVTYESVHQAPAVEPRSISFPYKWALIHLDEMFIDKTYQRPITSFAERIQRNFDPGLFQILVLSDRGESPKRRRYSIIDGQTRWAAASAIGVEQPVPCIVFSDITPQQEADLFARFQTERRGMMSWHRFRAALAAGKPEARAIKKLVEEAGYEIGDGKDRIGSIAALEVCYRSDEFLLARTLSDLKEAWPDVVPEASHIRGLHFFFRHYPLEDKNKHLEVDDPKLVRRLRVVGPEGLKAKMSAARTSSLTKNSSNATYMAQAIQNAYLSR